MARQAKNAANLDVLLISAATGFGFDKLEDRLKVHMTDEKKRSVFIFTKRAVGVVLNEYSMFRSLKSISESVVSYYCALCSGVVGSSVVS